jgi:hypothetical protein
MLKEPQWDRLQLWEQMRAKYAVSAGNGNS